MSLETLTINVSINDTPKGQVHLNKNCPLRCFPNGHWVMIRTRVGRETETGAAVAAGWQEESQGKVYAENELTDENLFLWAMGLSPS